MRLLGADGVAVPREDYERCRGQVVIHCAAVVPKSDEEADNGDAAAISLTLVERLLVCEPRFLVFVSTRAEGSAYAAGKRYAEDRCFHSGIPTCVIRLPGLYGPPKERGLVWTAARAILAGQSFTPQNKIPDWYSVMPVEEAAQLCVTFARNDVPCPGPIKAFNGTIEAFLSWVRE